MKLKVNICSLPVKEWSNSATLYLDNDNFEKKSDHKFVYYNKINNILRNRSWNNNPLFFVLDESLRINRTINDVDKIKQNI